MNKNVERLAIHDLLQDYDRLPKAKLSRDSADKLERAMKLEAVN